MTTRFSTAAISTVGKGLLATALLLGAMGDVATAANPVLRSEVAQAVKEGPRQGRHARPDLAAAAAELGTTEAELRQALGIPSEAEMQERRRERFAAAATELGVTETQLRDALGITLDAEGRPQRPQSRPDLAAVASELGVSETELRSAFGGGDRRQRPRPDIAGAAEQLGVTEAELREALGMQGRGDRPRQGRR